MQQIIAFGGRGFSSDAEDVLLDEYILKQTNAARPNVCFLPQASGDSESYTVAFYAAYARYNCKPSHLTLFARTPDLRDLLPRQHIIYVGGGNTRSMLALWRDWGIVEILREALETGTILTGPSAGAICWFEQGITDSMAGRLAVLPCMGFLNGSCCPHYDGEPDRRPAFHDFLTRGEILPGYAIEDQVGIHFRDGEVHKVIRSRPSAQAYRMDMLNGEVVETPLAAESLDAN